MAQEGNVKNKNIVSIGTDFAITWREIDTSITKFVYLAYNKKTKKWEQKHTYSFVTDDVIVHIGHGKVIFIHVVSNGIGFDIYGSLYINNGIGPFIKIATLNLGDYQKMDIAAVKIETYKHYFLAVWWKNKLSNKEGIVFYTIDSSLKAIGFVNVVDKLNTNRLSDIKLSSFSDTAVCFALIKNQKLLEARLWVYTFKKDLLTLDTSKSFFKDSYPFEFDAFFNNTTKHYAIALSLNFGPLIVIKDKSGNEINNSLRLTTAAIEGKPAIIWDRDKYVVIWSQKYKNKDRIYLKNIICKDK